MAYVETIWFHFESQSWGETYRGKSCDGTNMYDNRREWIKWIILETCLSCLVSAPVLILVTDFVLTLNWTLVWRVSATAGTAIGAQWKAQILQAVVHLRCFTFPRPAVTWTNNAVCSRCAFTVFIWSPHQLPFISFTPVSNVYKVCSLWGVEWKFVI